jgi:hypothetical protein
VHMRCVSVAWSPASPWAAGWPEPGGQRSSDFRTRRKQRTSRPSDAHARNNAHAVSIQDTARVVVPVVRGSGGPDSWRSASSRPGPALPQGPQCLGGRPPGKTERGRRSLRRTSHDVSSCGHSNA